MKKLSGLRLLDAICRCADFLSSSNSAGKAASESRNVSIWIWPCAELQRVPLRDAPSAARAFPARRAARRSWRPRSAPSRPLPRKSSTLRAASRCRLCRAQRRAPAGRRIFRRGFWRRRRSNRRRSRARCRRSHRSVTSKARRRERGCARDDPAENNDRKLHVPVALNLKRIRRRRGRQLPDARFQHAERRAQNMIPKSMPSGFDPMGGNRFSAEIMLKANNLDRDPIQLSRLTV